tara:strand:+ start:848 stop:1090 length:243 start_codon:yes stop_codon:yes gene_type:complete
MGLKDTLNSVEVKKAAKENFCAYQVMYDSLSKEDQKALDEAWAKGYSANVVLMALRQEGIRSSNESIRRHKESLCKCGNK